MANAHSNEQFIQHILRFNFAVYLLDGGFFGFALGFASFIIVIPLFDSQLMTAGWISLAKRIKPLDFVVKGFICEIFSVITTGSCASGIEN